MIQQPIVSGTAIASAFEPLGSVPVGEPGAGPCLSVPGEPFLILPSLRALRDGPTNVRAAPSMPGAIAAPPGMTATGGMEQNHGSRHGAGTANISGAVLEEISAIRREQAEKYGHTRQADLAQPFDHFARLILSLALKSEATGIREGAQFNQPPALQRKRLLRLIATALAAVDWLDAQPVPPEPGGSPER